MGEYIVGNQVEIFETFTVDGTPTDPTSVTFRVRSPIGQVTSYVNGVDTEVSNPSVGVYLLLIIPDVAGEWRYEVQGTGAVLARSPSGTFLVDDSAVVPTAPPPVLPGPCAAWIDGQDVAECCSVANVGSDFGLFENVAQIASEWLYDLSGRRYAGVCTQTVRPCQSNCWALGMQVLSRGHLVYPGWGWNGFGWWWDQAPFCGCSPLSTVELAGYPIRRITEVKIDGAVVDDATYRLDRTKLVRTEDPVTHQALAWPSCQNLHAADTEIGTFSVTYEYGADPPRSGIEAAKQLACQLWLHCNNQECQLPDGVTRVTRQGVTFEKPAFISWAHQGAQSRGLVYGWHTGLPLVDLFLNGKNPSGLRRRPAIMSPESVHRYAPNLGTG